MKVLALVILVVASASGKGSGPYLPSGWRPQGPAFYLPSEVKSSENPIKDLILDGSEASGSDFLREYGPPKVQELSQNLINQGLPDVATEQTFDFVPIVPLVVAEVKEAVEAAVETAVENNEAKTEEAVSEQTEGTTESAAFEKVSVGLPILEVDSYVETSKTTLADGVETTNTNVEVTQSENVVSSEGVENVAFSQSSQRTETTNQQSSQESSSSNVEGSNVETFVSEQVSQVSANQQESVISEKSASKVQSDVTEKSEVSSEESSATLEQVQNIPDIIASLEYEVKAKQVNEAVNDVTSVQAAGPLDAPEGFLEYGPPGFTEYGPPKGDLSQEAREEKTADVSFETNETRRRRFSPKFRSSKKH